MKQTILNVDADTVSLLRLASAMVTHGVGIRAILLNKPNGTGHTHVVFIDGDATSDAQIAKISDTLGEDCIAAQEADGSNGRLLGPRADAWLPFNPDFFIVGR